MNKLAIGTFIAFAAGVAATAPTQAGTCNSVTFSCGTLNFGELYTFNGVVPLGSLPANKNFSQTWTFSLASNANQLYGVIKNGGFKLGGTDFGTVTKLDVKLKQGATSVPVDEGGGNKNRSFDVNTLAGGTYSLTISGKVKSDSGPGIYFGSMVAMVPELETWVMMAAGLGFVGWQVRRRAQRTNDVDAGAPVAA